jgi:putative phage-type endonuclease
MTTRESGVSGTEVSALFGMNPWLTKMGLYARKKGLVDEVKPSERMKIGKALEPVVVHLYEEATGNEVEWKDKLISHPKEPLIIGTPDGFIGEKAIFEAKTAGLDRAFEWGDEGTDFVPQHYLMQVQHYMMLTGMKQAEVAALIGGNDFRRFSVPADEELQAMMLDEIRRFWRDHIEAGVAPEIDASEESRSYLLRRFPSATEGVRQATDGEDELVVGILQTRKELKFLTERKETLQNQLKDSIGFAKGLTSTHGKVSWSETPEVTVQSFVRKAGRTLRITGRRGEVE